MDIPKFTDKLEKIANTYSEKFQITRSPDWYILKLQEELGELVQSYLMMTAQARKKGKSQAEMEQDFQQEVADVFAMTLLLAREHGIDIEKAVEKKWFSWDK